MLSDKYPNGWIAEKWKEEMGIPVQVASFPGKTLKTSGPEYRKALRDYIESNGGQWGDYREGLVEYGRGPNYEQDGSEEAVREVSEQ